MRQPDEFDSFYKDSRERLLVSTFALTGDRVAARRAVRDAYVVAWYRWRKLSALLDPETEVRPLAWRLAQRRHTARVWHREKDLDPEVRATLDSLGKLSYTQRRALLLTQLAGASMADTARELGLPLEAAERELQEGAARFSAARERPTTDIRALLEPVAATAVAGVRWQRPTIVRRAGAARRRSHTLFAVGAAVAVLVTSGVVLSEGGAVQAGLRRDTPAPSQEPGLEPVDPVLPTSSLVSVAQLDDGFPARAWEVGRTTENDEAMGGLPCQTQRYADPDGVAALLRTFRAERDPERNQLAATQFTEASADDEAAARTYRTSLRWYAGCTDARVQLLGTRRPERTGDEAIQFTLRAWDDPVTTYVVGVARTGVFTTTTILAERSRGEPDEGAAASMLSAAVDNLCVLGGAGTCGPPEPELNDRAPVQVGEEPGLLSEVDLPPVGSIEQPWVGTDPERASATVAASRCDQAGFTGGFQGSRFSHNVTRSFVVPEAEALPDVFGITETVAALPRQKADAFVDQVRRRLASCPADDLGTESELVRAIEEDDLDAAIYRVTVDVSDADTLTYFTAVMRDRTAVGQLSFVPAPDADMADGAFEDLVLRALARMNDLPRPSS